MGFIKTIQERYQNQHEADIHQQAEELLTVTDFSNALYIAYGGIPLVPIEADWTTKEILQELSLLRQNFINAKMSDYNSRVVKQVTKQ